MKFKLFATLTVLLSTQISASIKNPSAYWSHLPESPIVESETNDYGIMTRHADGSIVQRHTLSEIVSILRPDNRSKVIYPDGTVVREYSQNGQSNRIFVTTYYPSGYTKTEDLNGQITYRDDLHKEATKLPYETMSELHQRINDQRCAQLKKALTED